jgi:hypothetical protein
MLAAGGHATTFQEQPLLLPLGTSGVAISSGTALGVWDSSGQAGVQKAHVAASALHNISSSIYSSQNIAAQSWMLKHERLQQQCICHLASQPVVSHAVVHTWTR